MKDQDSQVAARVAQSNFGFLKGIDPVSSESCAPGIPTSDIGVRNDHVDIWPIELTRRLRVLLHTVPLDALRRGDATRDPELRHYDGLALALRVLDVVIDRLGLEAEADREVVTRVLRPVLTALDLAAEVPVSAERHDLMVDKLLVASAVHL